MRNRKNTIAFAIMLSLLSFQVSGCAGAIGGLAAGAGKLALGAGKLAVGAARGAGRLAVAAAPAAPAILNTVAQATGSPGVALARDITATGLNGIGAARAGFKQVPPNTFMGGNPNLGGGNIQL